MSDRRAALAPVYAEIVLDNLARDYPYAAHHVALDDADAARTPKELHPSFATSFDWHSCVHMHWLGVSLLGYGLEPEQAARLRAVLGANLTESALAVEVDYLRSHPGWERPYGWAWLVRLASACAASDDAQVRGWGRSLRPAVDAVADLVTGWARSTEWPVRHGVHTNTAFGLGMLLTAFRRLDHTAGADACATAAVRWFASDQSWDHGAERSGQDFLSASLSEADLLRRVLPQEEFGPWFRGFLPDLQADSLVLAPASVVDETDGYQVHLHGLNLSRAAQTTRLADALTGTAEGTVLALAHPALLQAGLAAVVTREYLSSHWLASFAWDALTASAERREY